MDVLELGLAGKVAIVTGGSEGLGRACVERFALSGAKVAVCARRTFEREAAGFTGVALRSARAGLVRIAMLMTPLGLAIGLLAALLP